MTDKLKNMSNALRALAMDAVQKANSGHPGMPMGFADVATILWGEFLQHNPNDPDWHNRDRFVLSAGHGSMLLYGLLYLNGYPGMDLSVIKNFRQLASPAAGHPEYGHSAGIETTTGPLGQGLANAVGMAIAERSLNAEFGELIDHKTYAVVGDGCLMEGISQEAITLAGHLQLKNLIVLFDDNGISIDGKISLSDSTDQMQRFASAGWNCIRCDGHDFDDIRSALTKAQASEQPCFIACKTVIGYGSPNRSDSSAAHGAPLGDDEIIATRQQLGWEHVAFKIPEDILQDWQDTSERCKIHYDAWQDMLTSHDLGDRFKVRMQKSSVLPADCQKALDDFKQVIIKEKHGNATRVASQKALEVLTPNLPSMIGGSADLTGSNNTKTADLHPFSADDYSGRYIYYGIRELGMAAMMNGLALHGGMIPYGGTFLVFTDYARPAMRLSALMGVQVIYVMTHDSIGLGEDGPTHQPVEHLAALRAIPNMSVFRPADALETAEAWEIALTQESPAVLALTRQNLPLLRSSATENLSAKGGYILHDGGNKQRNITLIASGSEVSLAMEAAQLLSKEGIQACVVSMPCIELFLQTPMTYQQKVLGDVPRIFIEAAVADSWYRFMRSEDYFIGMSGFGASAPAADLYKHFGITSAEIAKAAKSLVG